MSQKLRQIMLAAAEDPATLRELRDDTQALADRFGLSPRRARPAGAGGAAGSADAGRARALDDHPAHHHHHRRLRLVRAAPPGISVVLPARDEGDRAGATIASALDAAAGPDGVEFVVVDDCSAPERRPSVTDAAARRRTTVVRSDRHLGVGAARNLAARHARGRVLFVTDAHTRFSDGWDRAAERLLAPGRILSVTILDSSSAWRGHGCRLIVPYMGTRWNTTVPDPAPP
ncbi:hypothetical protein GCM10020000_55790 [Streptomyces olivoverticillatus]